ncbi:molybdopterin molybdotransferase MoeA [Sphingosinicella sp. CPCC 101087]|uniref:molybdopterin molybdotransferase MoeA n=1 Tax=Sphingosinicella sp. CPCC 101087 TaxID=2497754 RepID=UPI00101CF276|nr:molybdopterin molybdotransferase MoeA [Sphingosinicella sp. CPCC 101087]
MIGFDEALALVADAAAPLGRERVAIAQAHGRVLAAPVAAQIAAPPWDASAMDGYAIRDADLADLPVQLAIIGESFPGSGFQGSLEAGSCVRLFTGAPVPAGADRVVIQEAVKREGPFATFAEPPGPARHIRRRGSDFESGDHLLDAGRRLDSRALVAAAGADTAEVEVWRRPRLAVLSTGDELVDPGRARDVEGSIPDSVSLGIVALAESYGAEPVRRRRLGDVLPEMETAAAEAIAAADLVVVTGGASVGEKDHARRMFEPAGLDLIFSKVAIKPGKPVWFGRAGGRLVLGLPGNPTSALVTARLLLAPLLAGLSGRDASTALRWRRSTLAEGLAPCGSRETFVRAVADDGAARPLSNQDSSAQRTLAAADLLIRRRPGSPAAEPGETVEVIDF